MEKCKLQLRSAKKMHRTSCPDKHVFVAWFVFAFRCVALLSFALLSSALLFIALLSLAFP